MPDFKSIALAKHTTVDEVSRILGYARYSMQSLSKKVIVKENGKFNHFKIIRNGFGVLNTDFGKFYQFDFFIDDKWVNYLALVKGDLDRNFNPYFKNEKQLLLRIDSGCETGQVFGDRTCECREQLALAMEEIRNAGKGIIIHIPKQDARGLGLPFKLATLTLQDALGLDTVEAAKILANDGNIDVRTYGGAVGILKFWGLKSNIKINLATNNPKKVSVFTENGFKLSGLTPVVIEPTKLTRLHLEAKQEKLGHIELIQKDKQDATQRNFMRLLNTAMSENDSLVCCGLDPDLNKMPKEITDSHASDRTKAFDFLHEVIDITAAHVCAYKIQKAFFDIFENGDRLLLDTIKYIKKRHAQIPIIIDSKIGDTSNTMKAYMDLIFSKLGADAVVVNPYMGDDVLAPFRNMENKAAIVLVKTSNKGGDIVQNTITATGVPLWIYVMELVVRRWNTSRNVMPVISSTESIDFSSIRKIIPDDMPILLAGFGAQGGKITKAHELLDSHKKGLVVNSSRAILYPYKTNDKNWRREIENAVIEMKRKINEIR